MRLVKRAVKTNRTAPPLPNGFKTRLECGHGIKCCNIEIYIYIVIPVVQESRRFRIPVCESVPISFLEFDTKFHELILITRKTDDSAG